MFSILLQTVRGVLNSLICTAHFSDNFNSVFNYKIEKLFCVCAVLHVKIEEQIGYLEFPF